MTLYAYFNHNAADPSPVTGWLDTDLENYALPDFRDLLTLTQEQWDGRMTNPCGWAVSAGVLVPYAAPVPLPQQAQTALAGHLLAGIAITSASLGTVNGTYALDAISTAQIFQIGTFANSFGVFPSGDTTQPYPDITGDPRIFTVPVFIAFLRAVASLISSMQTQTGILSQGGTPTWPAQSANIA